jgi:ABC-type multidrug transport system ATPase subunit
MEIRLISAGKKFDRKWVIRDLHARLESGVRHAVTGRNGSGKSTLLLMLSAFQTPTEGTIRWAVGGREISPEAVFRHVTMASPSLELIEEFSLEEAVRFQQKFRPFVGGLRAEEVIGLSGMAGHYNKPIRQYSSGMKQRAKLLLALLGSSRLVLLDEPCSHLDSEGVAWYHELVQAHATGRTLVVASNHNPLEYPETQSLINLDLPK